ncbi:MAG: right-handed parallel beta-helix repeat-containing protein, partial [Streptosporangiaceae bacterium]
MTSDGRSGRGQRAGYTGFAVVTALCVFALLGALPVILPALGLATGAAPTVSAGVHLLQAPPPLRSVLLPAAARPVSPRLPAATLPRVSESQEAVAVGAQDNWLRAILHASFRSALPRIVFSPGQLPTLVLPSRPLAPAYMIADLIRDGAARLLPDGSVLLQDNVFVASGARLVLTSGQVRAIYLNSRPRGSASIVGWGGSLVFAGTVSHPLIIEGWDEATMTPAADTGRGRPYIREVAGRMAMTNVQVSFLGFWSGRTGGVAWTGLASHPSTGGATSSTFKDDTYGVFVARGLGVRFSGDLFESNQLDGFHVHRGTIGTSAAYSAAVRNGANGFHVDRATLNTVLQDDVSENNTANGFLVDGRPLVASASASGDGVAPGSGVRIENSAATGNTKVGILVEGGSGTVLSANEICARQSGIALRFGATSAVLTGNDVRCRPRVGIALDASAPQALLSGNAVSNARIGVLVANSGHIEMDHSRIAGATVFGISIRGRSSAVFGQDNVISGTGFRAVDVRADAPR